MAQDDDRSVTVTLNIYDLELKVTLQLFWIGD